MAVSLVVEGVLYESIAKVCRRYGVDTSLYHTRIRNGWSIEEALGIKKRERTRKGLENICEPKGYSNLKSLCKDFSKNYSVVLKRVNKGLSLDDALDYDRSITVRGKTYTSLSEACKVYGLDYAKVRARLCLGWSLDDALNPLGRNVYVIEGKEYRSLRRACIENNLPYEKVRYLVVSGQKSIDEAFSFMRSLKNRE